MTKDDVKVKHRIGISRSISEQNNKKGPHNYLQIDTQGTYDKSQDKEEQTSFKKGKSQRPQETCEEN